MRKSWTKISNFFKALGGAPIEVGKRKLFRHTRDLFWQVTPYVIWAVIILVVFLTTAQTLITVRGRLQWCIVDAPRRGIVALHAPPFRKATARSSPSFLPPCGPKAAPTQPVPLTMPAPAPQLRRPIQNNYLANRLAGRTSRVTADAHEMCSVVRDGPWRHVACSAGCGLMRSQNCKPSCD